ncbi:hypothetical protein [Oecophyllibacter saccharovorans]|uniref:hypothetical protein n=1 Tax=Oecophyllibacter saccharovorans TaxID=2558360 RepID=UPI001E2B3506|nr:hypothetical protein [Oecophyllibacter saccharovorans]
MFLGLLVLGAGLGSQSVGRVQAQGAPCQYDVNVLPVFGGVVSRVTPDGFMFTDGTDVVLPESLLPYPRLDQPLKVLGLKALKGKKVWALAIAGNPPICPSLHDVHMGAYPGSPAYDIIIHGVNPGL